jgi:hypothetical protein
MHAGAISNFEIEVIVIFGHGKHLWTHFLVDLKTLFGQGVTAVKRAQSKNAGPKKQWGCSECARGNYHHSAESRVYESQRFPP